jgi:hypothetical protein
MEAVNSKEGNPAKNRRFVLTESAARMQHASGARRKRNPATAKSGLWPLEGSLGGRPMYRLTRLPQNGQGNELASRQTRPVRDTHTHIQAHTPALARTTSEASDP